MKKIISAILISFLSFLSLAAVPPQWQKIYSDIEITNAIRDTGHPFLFVGKAIYVITPIYEAKTADRIFPGKSTTGVFRSTDGGKNWQRIIDGIFPKIAISLYDIVATKNNTLYLSTDEGLYESTNGGNSWQLSQTQLPPPYYADEPIYLATDNNGTLYAAMGGSNGDIFILNDQKWDATHFKHATYTDDYGKWKIYSITIDKHHNNDLILADNKGVHQYSKQTKTWSSLVTEQNYIMNKLIIDTQGKFYGITLLSRIIYQSQDRGVNWTAICDENTWRAADIELDNQNNLYAIGTTNIQPGIYQYSKQPNNHWLPLAGGLHENNITPGTPLSISADNNGHLYAIEGGEYHGIYQWIAANNKS